MPQYLHITSGMTAQEIRAMRANMNVTQLKFAVLFGVSLRTVQGWERGVKPTKQSIKLLKQAATFFST